MRQGASGGEILLIGRDEQNRRLQMSCAPINNEHYQLAFLVFDASGRAVTPMFLSIPFGHRITVELQIAPSLGWIRVWVNGGKVGDILIPPFAWASVAQVRMGSATIAGEISEFWLKPWALGKD
jgi:hypothetical protein